MTSNEEPYEMLNLECCAPLASTSLYNLEPIGIGTPLVESLSSFVKRLARIHHLTLDHFVSYCRRISNLNHVSTTAQKLRTIDGITPSAEEWIRILENLTGVKTLSCLTMARWKGLFINSKLLRLSAAWCPYCIIEWREQGSEAYEPLLWRLGAAVVCPLHETPLIEICPSCRENLSTVTAKSVVGYCPHCSQWLGLSYKMDSEHPVISGTDEIKQVTRLLACNPLTRQNYERVAIDALDFIKQNQLWKNVKIGHSLKLSITAFRALQSGSSLPSFAVFLRLCALSNDYPLYQIEGTKVTIQETYLSKEIVFNTAEKSLGCVDI